MNRQKVQRAPPAFLIRIVLRLHAGLTALANKLMPPEVQVLDMASGMWRAFLIHTAAKLDLADLLKDAPKTPTELASRAKVDSEALHRMLRALASMGIFRETGDGRFETTPLGKALETEGATSVKPLALLIGDPTWREPWAALQHSIETGESAFEHVFGEPYFNYLREHQEPAAIFNAWMSRISQFDNPILASKYDFSRAGTVVDVGGGQGVLISTILEQTPSLKGILFDMPEVVNGELEIDESVVDRCEVQAGNFFESVPQGGDVYMMKAIIHDWDDENAIRILRNCNEAMLDDSRLLVLDAVVPPGNDPDIVKLLDIQMMVITHGGRERTARQFRELFDAAGFELIGIRPALPSMFCIIEGRKAGQS